ncbi:unnamed protein product, partial [Prorocentrum cordatum]
DERAPRRGGAARRSLRAPPRLAGGPALGTPAALWRCWLQRAARLVDGRCRSALGAPPRPAGVPVPGLPGGPLALLAAVRDGLAPAHSIRLGAAAPQWPHLARNPPRPRRLAGGGGGGGAGGGGGGG